MHRRVIYQSLAWVPIAAGAATIAFTTTSHQLINKTVVYEDRTTYAQTPVAAAETITADKWYQPLTTPTRRPKQIAVVLAGTAYGNFTPAPAETVTIDKWWRELVRPIREHRRITDQQDFAAPPQDVAGNASIAFTTTSHQRIDKTIVYEESAYTPFTPVVAETVTIDKWWRELDRPVRRRQITAEEGSLFASPPRPEAGDQIAWHRQLDWPTRRKVVVEGAYSVAPPKPEANDQTAWRRDLDLPPRVKRLPVTAGLSFVAAAPGAGTAYNWFSAIDLPTRLKRSSQTEIGYVYFLPPSAEEVTVDKWWRELDRPVRRKLAGQEPQSFYPLPPAPPSDWLGSLDRPALRRRMVFEPLSFAWFTPVVAETITIDKWYMPLGEPQRLKRLATNARQFEVRAPFPQVPWGWYARLDEPLRIKRLSTGQISLTFVAAAPGSGVAYNWFAPIDVPLRTKRSLRTELGYSYLLPTAAETVTIDKWWRELDRPTRRVKPVPQLGYTFVAAAPGRGVAYNWFGPLDTPTRRVRRIAVQQFGGYANFTPADVVAIGYNTTSAQILKRTIIYEDRVLPPLGVTFPAHYAQSITVSVTVAFGRLLERMCIAQQEDGSVTQAEQTSGWQTQAENAIDSVVESEQTPDWQTQAENGDETAEQSEADPWGCGNEET